MNCKITNSFVGIGLAFLLSGCAVGQKINYNAANLELSHTGNASVAVAVLDHRSYVKNGEKERNYVGKLRGGFGNPFDLTTESEKPLADDMSSVVCASIKKNGFACATVSVEPNESASQATDKLKATKSSKLLLFLLKEWYSDSYTNTGLTYDLILTVMDNSGSSLAEQEVKGDDELGGSFWNPPGHAKEAVPAAYKKKLETLLNDPSVIKALK